MGLLAGPVCCLGELLSPWAMCIVPSLFSLAALFVSLPIELIAVVLSGGTAAPASLGGTISCSFSTCICRAIPCWGPIYGLLCGPVLSVILALVLGFLTGFLGFLIFGLIGLLIFGLIGAIIFALLATILLDPFINPMAIFFVLISIIVVPIAIIGGILGAIIGAIIGAIPGAILGAILGFLMFCLPGNLELLGCVLPLRFVFSVIEVCCAGLCLGISCLNPLILALTEVYTCLVDVGSACTIFWFGTA